MTSVLQCTATVHCASVSDLNYCLQWFYFQLLWNPITSFSRTFSCSILFPHGRAIVLNIEAGEAIGQRPMDFQIAGSRGAKASRILCYIFSLFEVIVTKLVLSCHNVPYVEWYAVCVFIPSAMREGSTIFGDHSAVLSNCTETSPDG